MSENKRLMINYKLSWCGGIVNNQIKKGLLLSVSEKKVLKLMNIWQSYKQESGCLMHFIHLFCSVVASTKCS